MKIKTLHAHFQISLNNYNNETVGWTVELEEGETSQSVVAELREQAKQIIGKHADELYSDRNKLRRECNGLENKLALLRQEWDATAEFLKAQGLNPTAPSMPQFRNLLTAVTVKSEVVVEEEDEEVYYEDDDDDDN